MDNMRSRNKKFKPPKCFLQEWGPYKVQTVVCIGASYKEIKNYLIKIKADPKAIKWFDKDKERIESELTGSHLGVFMFEKPFSVLWLKDFEDTWTYWETLIHELSHAIDFVLREERCMQKETEACAYQIEFLFREIRRKLMGLDKIEI